MYLKLRVLTKKDFIHLKAKRSLLPSVSSAQSVLNAYRPLLDVYGYWVLSSYVDLFYAITVDYIIHQSSSQCRREYEEKLVAYSIVYKMFPILKRNLIKKIEFFRNLEAFTSFILEDRR